MVAKNEQGEVRAPEEIEQADLVVDAMQADKYVKRNACLPH